MAILFGMEIRWTKLEPSTGGVHLFYALFTFSTLKLYDIVKLEIQGHF